jgi:hypothetical protein
MKTIQSIRLSLLKKLRAALTACDRFRGVATLYQGSIGIVSTGSMWKFAILTRAFP